MKIQSREQLACTSGIGACSSDGLNKWSVERTQETYQRRNDTLCRDDNSAVMNCSGTYNMIVKIK